MATVTLHETPFNTIGELAAVGTKAAPFTLSQQDLSDLTLDSLAGKTVVLNIFPSIDTPTCATSVREFNTKAAALENTVVICVSADLPFALGRFCGAEGIEDVLVGSTFRSTFGQDYAVEFSNGPLTALLSRAVVVIGADGNVRYTEQVAEIADEPNYADALASI
ncbi:MAG: thiol peroxidase [Candidatus Endobugula sp.]|jgi:thiol peroxidase